MAMIVTRDTPPPQNRDPGIITMLSVMVVLCTFAYAAFSQTVTAALAAIAILHLVLILSRTGPGAGIALLTTGRFVYFVALLLLLHREGDTAYTAAYFFVIDVLIFVSLLNNNRWLRIRSTSSRLFLFSLVTFTCSTIIGWIISDYSDDGLYLLGTYIVFAICPLIATLGFTTRQVLSACRWMFWSITVLAVAFCYEAIRGSVSWFYGRASLEVLGTPQIGSLFIGSVIPIGLFAGVFLGKELVGSRKRSLYLITQAIRWAIVTLFVGMLAFTGQRTPVVALLIAGAACLLVVPRIRIGHRLGIACGVCILFASASFFPNSSRFDVLSEVVHDGFQALSVDNTASIRLDYYRICINTFLTAPIFGTGLGSFYEIASRATTFPDRIPHNAFLEVAAGQGLSGSIPLALLIGGTIVVAVRDLRRSSSRSSTDFRLVGFALISSLYELALVGMTSSVFADSTLWCLFGMIWALHRRQASGADHTVTIPAAAESRLLFKPAEA